VTGTSHADIPMLVDRIVIGDELADAAGGEVFDTLNPATGQPLATLPAGTAQDVDRAVAAARDAQHAWARRSPATRERVLLALAERVESAADDLARLESLDVGKPVSQARAIDVAMAIDGLRYHAGMASKVEGRTIPTSRRYLTITRREPVGVIAGIVPWNFGLLSMTAKLGPALAAGNAIVIKPSPLAPLSSLALGRLALEAGLPPGLLSVVTDDGSAAGEALVRHPAISHVSFTGSPEVGRKVAAAAGEQLKTCITELGGKSALVVLDDADLQAAAQAAFLGIFINQGEMCTASSRLLVSAQVHDHMLDAAAVAARSLKIGDPADASTVLGPLISAPHRERVERFVESGRQSGAELACGGARPPNAPDRGFFFEPTVFDRVRPDAEIAREEIFGPVLSVIPFQDEEEALRIANATRYGLGAGVFTRSIDRALRFAEGVESGNVWVNAYNLLHPAVPFGGMKHSGFGREGGFSGMVHVTREKSIWLAG